MVSPAPKRQPPNPVRFPADLGRPRDRVVHRRVLFPQDGSIASLAEYSRWVRRNPDDPRAYGGRGIAYLNKGDYGRTGRFVSARRQRCFDKAITDLTKAIQLAPDDPSLYLWRGIAFRARGQLDKAIGDLTEAIRLEPTAPRAYVERSAAHQQKGEMNEAEADNAKADDLAVDLW